MNKYEISVDQSQADLCQWLTQNGCPKAAASLIKGNGYTSRYRMGGNVSTLSQIAVFKKCGIRYKVKPLNGSQPLDNSLLIGESMITFA